MPPGTDAVVPLDAIVSRGGRFEAIAPVTAGDGVLATHGDIHAGGIIAKAGWRLSALNVATTQAGTIQVLPPTDSNLPANLVGCTGSGVVNGNLTNCKLNGVINTTWNGEDSGGFGSRSRTPTRAGPATQVGGCWFRLKMVVPGRHQRHHHVVSAG